MKIETDPSKEDKEVLRWFSCLSCDVVQWQDVSKRSHCFVCGKWGKRGQWRSVKA